MQYLEGAKHHRAMVNQGEVDQEQGRTLANAMDPLEASVEDRRPLRTPTTPPRVS